MIMADLSDNDWANPTKAYAHRHLAVVLVRDRNAEGWDFVNYPEATTNEYTPNAATDGGRFLRVTATYTDPLSAYGRRRHWGQCDERVATTGPIR